MYSRRRLLATACYLTYGAMGFSLSACNSSTATNATLPQVNTADKEVIIRGVGAVFPAPLYETWAEEFSKTYPHIHITYQAIGSSAGIKQFVAGLVDFAASDTPLSDGEIARVGRGAFMFPITGSSVVLAYNLPDISNLRLSRTTYVHILSGKIRRWDDPAIHKDNPNAQLPSQEIRVIYPTVPKTTTAVLSRHLSAVSKEWHDSLPVGTGVVGSEAVVAQIQQNVGSLGCLEYAHAQRHNLAMAQLQNRAGKFVAPIPASQTSALAQNSPDPQGEDAYPILVRSWLLVYRSYDSPPKATAMQTFLSWALEQGQELSIALGFSPLPTQLISQIQSAIAQIKGTG